MNRERKSSKARRPVLIIILSILILILAAGLYMSYAWFNSMTFAKDKMFVEKEIINIDEPTPSPSPAAPNSTADLPDSDDFSIEFEGKYYILNPKVVSVLFIGIDTDKKAEYEGIVLNSHQADALILGVIDTENRDVTFLNIPRDAIVDVQQLDATCDTLVPLVRLFVFNMRLVMAGS